MSLFWNFMQELESGCVEGDGEASQTVSKDELLRLLGFYPRLSSHQQPEHDPELSGCCSKSLPEVDQPEPDVPEPKKEEEERGENVGGWALVPDLILEEIYAYMKFPDRYSMSQVCKNWYRVFYSPLIWNYFRLDDRKLTRPKFNYYLGYQYMLDHYRTQLCLHKIGRHIRTLHITPMNNIMNLHEFMVISTYYSQRVGNRNHLERLTRLDFTFYCTYMSRLDDRQCTVTTTNVYGTGGQLLKALKEMMKCLTGMKHLALRNLLLDDYEASYLLDDVVENTMLQLQTLTVINCSKSIYPMLHCGVFLNLQTLRISPQHLDVDLIALLPYTALRDLYIVQNDFTELGIAIPAHVWRQMHKIRPQIEVHLRVEGGVMREVICQEGAPVASVIYRTPYNRICPESALVAASTYAKTLKVYGFLGTPRFHMNRSFADRPDSSLLLLCRTCEKLEVLIVRELISTATLLLLAYYGQGRMKQLIVRSNALLKRCDWKQNAEWSEEFYRWLRTSSRDFDRTIDQVRNLLQNPTWHPLSDKEYNYYCKTRYKPC